MKVLQDYAREPGSPIAGITPMDDAVPGWPGVRAEAMVFFRPDFDAGSAPTGDLITTSSEKGMHGGRPDDPALRSIFIAAGPGVPHGRDLGTIDMRAIAPTLAHLLKVTLPEAGKKPLF